MKNNRYNLRSHTFKDFMKPEFKVMINIASQKKSGRKYGISVSDYILKDKNGNWTIPVLVARKFTEGTVADKLKLGNFLPSEYNRYCRIILSLDKTPIGCKKDLINITSKSKTLNDVGIWFGPKFKMKMGTNPNVKRVE